LSRKIRPEGLSYVRGIDKCKKLFIISVGGLKMSIAEDYVKIRNEIPENVVIVIAAKTRTMKEIEEVIDAGATDIGENYVQEAEKIYKGLSPEKAKQVKWHMIGPLQKNKINKALGTFDVIQTIDSFEIARAIDKRVSTHGVVLHPAEAGRVWEIVPVYIEVNIAGEKTKSGIAQERVLELIELMSGLENIKVEGLMTMEPYSENPEDARPYFKKMKELFEKAKEIKMPNVDIKILSMGMSNSYKVAIEEGSNMVRVGTAIFGPRN